MITNTTVVTKNHDFKYKNLIVNVINEKILLVQINRIEKRNAVDRETSDELYDVFKNHFERDDALLVGILGSVDSKISGFSSGADLSKVSTGDLERMNRLEFDTDRGPMGVTRLLLSKPVLASIPDGYCVAGGLELALWCDLRVCTENAVFGVFCRRFGVPLIDGGTVRLPRLIGQSRALDLILTGRPVCGKEAFEIGLVNRIVSNPKELLSHTIELATLISKFPQECMKSDRRSLYEQSNLSLDDALKNEFKLGYKSLKLEGINGSNQFINNKIGRHGIIDSKL